MSSTSRNISRALKSSAASTARFLARIIRRWRWCRWCAWSRKPPASRSRRPRWCRAEIHSSGVVLKLCSQLPEFRKKLDLEHLAQVGDARRAAGSALQADDALDRRDVVEAPAAEIVFEIDQLFRQLVEHPVFRRRRIDGLPGLQNLVVWRALDAPVGSACVVADVKTIARQ